MSDSRAFDPRCYVDRRSCLIGAASGAFLGANGCGWLLYPERRGRSGGEIDVVVLVVDLLWLLPGLVPGAVCLAVDFTSGAIYRRSSVAARSPTPSQDPVTARVGLDGRVVAEASAGPGEELELSWFEEVDPEDVRARGGLRLDGATGGVARGRIAEVLQAR